MAEYSLLTEPWIDVLSLDGQENSVGLVELFRNAHTYERFNFSTVGFDLAVLRLLVALVYIVDPPENAADWKKRIELGKFEKSFIDGLKKYADRLDLFHEKYPFMQETSLKLTKEKDREQSAKLNRKLPTKAGHLHFQHIFRDSVKICAKCATPMLLFEQLFCVGSGSGYKRNHLGGPPYFISLEGLSIFETVVLNSPSLDIIDDKINTKDNKKNWPREFTGNAKTKDINMQEGLLWKSRQFYLFNINADELCSICNSKTQAIVSSIVMKKQKAEFSENDFWNDPFTSITYKNNNGNSIKGNQRPNNNQTAIWRDYISLLFENREQNSKFQSFPPINLQFNSVINANFRASVKVHGYFGDKATVYHIKNESFFYNPGFDFEDVNFLQQIISKAETTERVMLKALMKISFEKKKEKDNLNELKFKFGNRYISEDEIIDAAHKPNDPPKEDNLLKVIKMTLRAASFKYWHKLNEAFQAILFQLDQRQDTMILEIKWNKTLKEVISEIFDSVALKIINNNNDLKHFEKGRQVLENYIHYNLKNTGGED